jgi:hypothetical protein
MGWSARFEDPINLPNGEQLVFLSDAGDYITKLPKARLRSPRMAGSD